MSNNMRATMATVGVAVGIVLFILVAINNWHHVEAFWDAHGPWLKYVIVTSPVSILVIFWVWCGFADHYDKKYPAKAKKKSAPIYY